MSLCDKPLPAKSRTWRQVEGHRRSGFFFFLRMTKGKREKRKDEGVVLQGDQAHFKNHSIAGEVDWLCFEDFLCAD